MLLLLLLVLVLLLVVLLLTLRSWWRRSLPGGWSRWWRRMRYRTWRQGLAGAHGRRRWQATVGARHELTGRATASRDGGE